MTSSPRSRLAPPPASARRGGGALLAASIFASWLSGASPAALAASDAARERPVLAGRTMRGEAVDLAMLRGQVVLLYFWSTDCPVCIQRLPELRRNLQGWKGKPFTVVAVNMDRTEQPLRDYEALLDRLAPPTPQMRIVWRGAAGYRDDLGEMPLNTPTTVVVDRAGEVVERVKGSWMPGLWDDIAELVVE